ncbi:hypothetical protein NDU88_003506 [Pleurodeles waltl]|uniref:Uncharacterized protein n=1 Tax=Pleurodeles waltl TaxID=8319 RepID=A0AAV7TPY0_PLEWA|nr:hypothetical protein NDU88_003506 [Pleurodeles waltl]
MSWDLAAASGAHLYCALSSSRFRAPSAVGLDRKPQRVGGFTWLRCCPLYYTYLRLSIHWRICCFPGLLEDMARCPGFAWGPAVGYWRDLSGGGILGPGVQAGVPHWSAATGYLQLYLTARYQHGTAFGVRHAASLPCCDEPVLLR